MTPLDKVVYIADTIEPRRDFPGVEDLRAMAHGCDLRRAVRRDVRALACAGVIERRRPIHPDTAAVWNWIVDGGAARERRRRRDDVRAAEPSRRPTETPTAPQRPAPARRRRPSAEQDDRGYRAHAPQRRRAARRRGRPSRRARVQSSDRRAWSRSWAAGLAIVLAGALGVAVVAGVLFLRRSSASTPRARWNAARHARETRGDGATRSGRARTCS